MFTYTFLSSAPRITREREYGFEHRPRAALDSLSAAIVMFTYVDPYKQPITSVYTCKSINV